MQTNDKENSPRSLRAKVPLRAQYLLEMERIKHEIGDIEQIRISLGLSQRQLCKLLLVDPSAWTRWVKAGPPPHVYQALNWLYQLKKQNPAVTGPRDISQKVDFLQSSTIEKIRDLETTMARLEKSVDRATFYEPATTDVKATAVDSELELALNQQEVRFTKEIDQLKKDLRLLVELAARPPSHKPRTRILRKATKRKTMAKRKKATSRKAKSKKGSAASFKKRYKVKLAVRRKRNKH